MTLRTPAPIKHYFDERDWKIAKFQRATWQAYLAGESGLIHAPTGSGKTLAAWFGPMIECLQAKTKALPLSYLWITPMRALAADTELSLKAACENLGLDITVLRRTGDSTAAERTRLRKKPPTAVITTPESLSLLLSYADFYPHLGNIRCVMVDEWHELMGSKRGVQLELCLARLRRINPAMCTWGISATIGNLEQAAKVLVGPNKKTHIIESERKKKTIIEAVIPANMEKFPWAGHLGLKLLPQVITAIESAKSTLVFVNTRSQAELWFEAILKARTDWIGTLALHHGSLSFDVRKRVEQGLKEGFLSCVVCTSSLDLGVDFSPVEHVIQIGSPKGIARLLQRAGRSGHQPGMPSRVLCVPTHSFELAEIAAARKAASEGLIESRTPYTLSLDVLVQHCVTLVLGNRFTPGEAIQEIRDTHAFEHLSDSAWQWVLDFITQGGPALEHYPEYHRVVCDDGKYTVPSRRIAQRHRMAIGTITSDSMMWLAWSGGGKLGTIEESFISRLTKDDAFLFNGRVLQLVRIKDMTAYVRVAKQKTRIVPRWAGGKAPLSTELAAQTQQILSAAASPEVLKNKAPEMKALEATLKVQQQFSKLPSCNETLIEHCKTREGHHFFIFTFAGRAVHEGLAALTAYRLTQQFEITFRVSANDYGFELLTRTEFEYSTKLFNAIFSTENLLEDIQASINQSESAKRQFRDIARIAGLIFSGYPGSSKTTRQIQSSSGIIFDVLQDYDPDNALVHQAKQEVLESQLELGKLTKTLQEMQQKPIALVETKKLTPLAFPLWAERIRGQTLSSEKFQTRLQRMLESLNKVAN